MLAAASVAEAIPKLRQNARLCQTDGAGARCRFRGDTEAAPELEALPNRWRPGRDSDRRFDARPSGLRRRHRRHRIGQPGEPFLPERHLGGERRLLREASFDLAPLLRAEHAQHVFSGNELATVGRIYGVVLAHPSRQALSFNNPRLIQLFIVPSGTLMRAASSS